MLPRTKKEIVIYVSTKRNADKKREMCRGLHIYTHVNVESLGKQKKEKRNEMRAVKRFRKEEI